MLTDHGAQHLRKHLGFYFEPLGGGGSFLGEDSHYRRQTMTLVVFRIWVKFGLVLGSFWLTAPLMLSYQLGLDPG